MNNARMYAWLSTVISGILVYTAHMKYGTDMGIPEAYNMGTYKKLSICFLNVTFASCVYCVGLNCCVEDSTAAKVCR